MIKNLKFCTIIFTLILCSACSKDIYYHGYNIDEDAVKKITPSRSNMNEVIAILGTPTTSALYGKPKFFYIYHKYSRRLFQNPKLIDQDILQISFSQNGIVESINRYSFADVSSLKFDKNTTYLPGNDISVIKQIIGNIGKYNNTEGVRKAGT